MAKLDFTRPVRAAEDVLLRELDDESVLLHLKTEMYFGLDSVGTRMWHVLTEAPTIDDACATLLDEYGVAPEVLRADLEELLGQLLDQGLLEQPEVAEGEASGQFASPESKDVGPE